MVSKFLMRLAFLALAMTAQAWAGADLQSGAHAQDLSFGVERPLLELGPLGSELTSLHREINEGKLDLRMVDSAEPMIVTSEKSTYVSKGFVKAVLSKSKTAQEAYNTFAAAFAHTYGKSLQQRKTSFRSFVDTVNVYNSSSADIEGAKRLEKLHIPGDAMVSWVEGYSNVATPLISESNLRGVQSSEKIRVMLFENDRIQRYFGAQRASVLRTWLASQNPTESFRPRVASQIRAFSPDQAQSLSLPAASNRFSHQSYLALGDDQFAPEPLIDRAQLSNFSRLEQTQIERKLENDLRLAVAHFEKVAADVASLERELDKIAQEPSIQAPRDLKKFIEKVFRPVEEGYVIGRDPYRLMRTTHPIPHQAEINRLRAKVVDVMKSSKFAQSIEPAELFRTLTLIGGQPETDRYFEQTVLPSLSSSTGFRRTNPTANELAKEMLMPKAEGRIISESTRANLFKLAMPDQSKLSSIEYQHWLKDLASVKRGPGKAWDQALEDFAWKYNGDPLVKSMKFLFPQPGSAIPLEQSIRTAEFRRLLDSAIKNLDPSGRKTLIEAIRDGAQTLPRSFENALSASVRSSPNLEQTYRALLGVRGPIPQSVHLASEAESYLLDRAGPIIADLRKNEQIALIDSILQAEPHTFAKHPDYPKNILREFLGYPAGSRQETAVVAWLNPGVTPAAEVSPNLAFLLSETSGKKGQGTLRAIFESQGTLGKKLGQALAHLEFFGQQGTQELLELEDRAKGMSFFQIHDRIEKLPAAEQNRVVKLVKKLNAASIKTVVEMVIHTDPNGKAEETVAGVFREPHAHDEVKGRVLKLRSYVKELSHVGLIPQSDVFQLQELLSDVEHQLLTEELSFKKESEKLAQAKTYFEKLNSDPKFNQSGWHFTVPQPVSSMPLEDDLMFLKFAHGVTDSGLSPGDREAVGKMLFRSTVRGAVGRDPDAIFDPDRHRKQQLFDPKKKEISILDVGQAEVYHQSPSSHVWDERTQIADLIQAIHSKDSKLIMKSVRPFARAGWPDAQGERQLQKEIQTLLDSGMESDVLAHRLIASFRKAGVRLDYRLSFKIPKGVSTLFRQNYVDKNSAAEILKEEIGETVKAKFPARIAQGTAGQTELKEACRIGGQSLFEFLKKSLNH